LMDAVVSRDTNSVNYVSKAHHPTPDTKFLGSSADITIG
jgi:hypothetical protein